MSGRSLFDLGQALGQAAAQGLGQKAQEKRAHTGMKLMLIAAAQGEHPKSHVGIQRCDGARPDLFRIMPEQDLKPVLA